MITPDKAKNMAVFDGAIDVNGRDETLDGLMALSDGFELRRKRPRKPACEASSWMSTPQSPSIT